MLSAIARALLSSELQETCGRAADTLILLVPGAPGQAHPARSARSWAPRLSGVYGNFQQLQTQASFILVCVCH